MTAHNIDNAFRQRARRQCHNRHIVRHQFASYLRITECHLTEDLLNLGDHLRLIGGKLATSRSCIEEVSHHKLRAHRAHRRCLRDKLTTIDNRNRTHLILCLAGTQLHLCHCGNRGQSLASETKGLQAIDIVKVANLTRGVSVKCHTGIDRRHTTSVIHNLNKFQTAITEIDRHGSCPGINSILHHLLDGR